MATPHHSYLATTNFLTPSCRHVATSSLAQAAVLSERKKRLQLLPITELYSICLNTKRYLVRL